MVPMKLKASLKDYLWGGDTLKREWGKQCDQNIVAESWELSAHRDGESVVKNGEFVGKTLSEVLALHPEYAGRRAAKFEMFPVLVKLIDSRQNLSIQVHPSDEYALREEGQYGKTEMWYVISAAEGAGIYYGFNRNVTKKEYEQAIQNNTVTDLLNFIKVKKGETYFIESGTVHAVCAGLLICEIQQNSNVTYRVYDYARLGADGKPRDLHIDRAVAVSTLNAQQALPTAVTRRTENGARIASLASCKYFTAQEYEVERAYSGTVDDGSFLSLTFLDGSGTVDGEGVQRGDTVFLPAGYGDFKVTGRVKFLASRV